MSNMIYAGSQWGLLLILAHFGGALLVGQYVYCLAILTPIFACASLQLRSIQATDVRAAYHFGHYIAVTLLGKGAALMLTTAFAFLFIDAPQQRALLGLVALLKTFEMSTETIYGHMQRRECMDLLAISRVTHGVLQLGFFAGGFFLSGNVVIAMSSLVAYRCSAGLGMDVLLLKQSDACQSLRELLPKWHRQELQSLTRVAVPLAASVLLTTLMNNCPKYFLAYYAGDAALGIFGAMMALLVAGATVTGAVNQASCSRLAHQYTSQQVAGFRRTIINILALYMSLGAIATTIAFWDGERILKVIFGAEFAPYSGVLLVVIAAGGFNYAAGLVETALVAIRRINLLSPLVGASSVCMFLACAALIPRFEMYGAAVALGIGKLPVIIGGLHAVLRSQPVEPQSAAEEPTPMAA